MCALRIEVPEVGGVVGVDPESFLRSRLDFDAAGLVVGFVSVSRGGHAPHVMQSDVETPENRGLRWFALGHDDVWTQDSHFSEDETAAVLE